jgi:hypothetical protein
VLGGIDAEARDAEIEQVPEVSSIAACTRGDDVSRSARFDGSHVCTCSREV